MPKRDLYILIIAGVCGVLGFFFSLNVLKGASRKSLPTYRFVKTAVPIPKGQAIETKNLVLSEPAPVDDPGDLFWQIQDAQGYLAIEDIEKGSKLRRSKVKQAEIVQAAAKPVKPQQPALPVPEGMRGFPLDLDQTEGFPYGLKVGSYLDLFGLMTNESGRQERRAIIMGAQVVAIEENSEKPEIKTVTIALPPVAVDIAVRAMGDGKLRVLAGPSRKEGVVYQTFGYAEIIRGVSREKAFQTIRGSSLGKKETLET